ncbi:MAG: hypothetical protein ACLP7Q_23100 [Isosphaeraceae bacterium]
MRAESLHEVIHAAPFRPFDLMLADGTRVHVPHPEYIAYPSGSRTAVVMGQDESVRILDVALVLGIEHGPPEPAGLIGKED